MSTLSIRLPKSVHEKIKELAKKEGVSINQLINSAVSEKISALITVEYLEKRGGLGSRKKFDAVLSKIAADEPEEYDAFEMGDYSSKLIPINFEAFLSKVRVFNPIALFISQIKQSLNPTVLSTNFVIALVITS